MARFNFTERVKPKIFINIGALLDIPTGPIVKGAKGESIINGGLGQVTAIVGAGNNFKSTILHYMMLSAADRICETRETEMMTYDTEINISLERLDKFTKRFMNLPPEVIFEENAVWQVVDKTKMAANKWAVEIEKVSAATQKDKSLKVTYQAFRDPYTRQPLVETIPSFIEVDSFTEFEAESTMEAVTKDLDSSDTNTMFMKQGNFKTKFTASLPRLTNQANMYVLMSAHIGEHIDMATGPAKYNQPTRKLQFLKTGDKIKGVGTKFFFLMNNAWMAHTASVLKNKLTKEPEYPAGHATTSEDLNAVRLTQLRGKNGPSGYTITVIVSQSEGVLPTLTEFHHVKTNDAFGLVGNKLHYAMALKPDVKLSRTTVRSKIDNDPLLRRAINITAELLQLKTFDPDLINEGLWCTPEELYADIKDLGYDWDVLLGTRGYWTIDQYDDSIPFLSTADLLNMRKGLYHPYWMDKDKKVMKKYKLIGADNEK